MDEMDIVLMIDGNKEVIPIYRPRNNEIAAHVIKRIINQYVGYLKDENKIPMNNVVTEATSPSFNNLSGNRNMVNFFNNLLQRFEIAADIIQIEVTTSPAGGSRRKTRKSRKRKI